MIHRDIVLEEDRALADRVVRAFSYFESCAAAITASVSGTCQSLARLRHDLAFNPYDYLRHQIHTVINIESNSLFILTVRPIDATIPARLEQPGIRGCLHDGLDKVRQFTLAEKINRHLSRKVKHGC